MKRSSGVAGQSGRNLHKELHAVFYRRGSVSTAIRLYARRRVRSSLARNVPVKDRSSPQNA
ncbi:hypothetical protein WN51_02628 [Melipona quadrifasciata]|uniref:Uncharacterized protein n=1 Tax=Melipona quadrifasciata TaxID=166423 RepID=A0A0N0BDR6_9HYME|nr:hypothetical protein WN51_02628 [Melipona quadrifasciata]